MLHIALVDDWELRGDGSGEMQEIQFKTIINLVRIYENYGLKASINAEIMQQLEHLNWGQKHPKLLELAREWEEIVKKVYRDGHDVQLHVHPQWENAVYEQNKWHLPGNWSITTYPYEKIYEMISRCKQYLENLLRQVDPSYSCVSYRSGSWCAAPSEHYLQALADLRISFDMSIVKGLKYDNKNVKLDYTNCDESFLPFYPNMQDARRLSNKPEPIICIPTQSFKEPAWLRMTRIAVAVFNKVAMKTQWLPSINSMKKPKDGLSLKNQTLEDYTVWQAGSLFEKIQRQFAMRVADLSNLNFMQMKYLISVLRKQAKASGWHQIPIILENHTKDIINFEPLEKFARFISEQADIKIVTLKEIYKNINAAIYKPIYSANEFGKSK